MHSETFSVNNIMIPIGDYPCIGENETIGNGVAVILEHSSADNMHLHYDELMVINNQDQLVGMLDTATILQSFFPSILDTSTGHSYAGKKQSFTDLSVLLEDHFRQECKRQATETVRQHMRVPHKSIDSSMHVLHVLEIMVKDRDKTLPVTENGILLGVVRLADIFRSLGGYCTM